MPTLKQIVQKEYRDVDGWWIEFNPGWVTCDEGTHGVVESTRRWARSQARGLAVPCDCAECNELIVKAQR